MSILSLLAPSHLARYRELAAVLAKHGRRDLLELVGLGALVKDPKEQDGKPLPTGVTPKAAELARDLERLGPVYVKLGQTLAGQADLLPDAYLRALSRLQNNVEPMDIDTVRGVIEESLGEPVEDLYAAFDPQPLGSASLGQVHAATLPDGSEVVVKVQRPGVRRLMKDDLDALTSLAELLDAHTEIGNRYRFANLISQLRRSLARELDYEREAAQLLTIGKTLDDFEELTAPRPDPARTVTRVLTMTRMRGRSVDDLRAGDHPTPPGFDGDHLLDTLFHAYLRQVLITGSFHADPHPGNVLLLDDGRLGLIDFGQTGFVEPAQRDRLLRLLLAVSEGRISEAADVAIDLGQPGQGFDANGFRKHLTTAIADHHQASFRQMNTGRLVAAVCRCGNESDLYIPESITLLGKMLLNLDQVAQALAPDFDTNASLKRHGSELATRLMVGDVSLTRAFTAALTAKGFVQDLPVRINRVMDVLADNRIRLDVDAMDEDRLITSLKNIANRIGVGLIIAALILAGAVLMHLDAGFTVWGYSGLGVIAFSIATILGTGFGVLVIWRDFKDEWDR